MPFSPWQTGKSVSGTMEKSGMGCSSTKCSISCIPVSSLHPKKRESLLRRGRPSSRKAFITYMETTAAFLLSVTPRPMSRPSFSMGSKGSWAQLFPTGTTSRWEKRPMVLSPSPHWARPYQ